MDIDQGPLGADTALRIGDVAAASGVSVRMLRHYDELGLLCPSWHTGGGHREYSTGDVLRLETIVTLRSLGFSLAEVKALLDGQTDPLRLLAQQVAALDATLATLQEARARVVVLRHRVERAEAPALDELLQLAALMRRPGVGQDLDRDGAPPGWAALSEQQRARLLASRSALAEALGEEGLAAIRNARRDRSGGDRGER